MTSKKFKAILSKVLYLKVSFKDKKSIRLNSSDIEVFNQVICNLVSK
jgi:hypothetical protein